MDMKLELVPVPVSDIDRAKAFYVEQVGFHADHDVQPGNGMRVLQSACSIVIGTGLGEISDLGGILFARFADPDGNSWLLQEIPARFKKGNG